jgi:NUMOD3 motif
MSKTIYCTYLTVYKGNKLPPFYIGSTSIDKINNGYHGSVNSKKYKQIWISELRSNTHLFKTRILTTHETREQALEQEKFFHESLDVVKSPLHVNQAIASKNGCFGVSLFGKDHPMYGKKHTYTTRKLLSEKCGGVNHSCYGKSLSDDHRSKISKSRRLAGKCLGDQNPMHGKKHTEEARKTISVKISGKNNGSYGKKWFYNPETNENIKCFPTEKPENYVPGRKIKPLSSM